MNFLIDESVDAPIAERLRADGHEVICVWELDPGITDDAVLAMANREQRPLVTADKDFGELVFRMRRIHYGVLLIRLAGLSAQSKADIVSAAVREHAGRIPGAFTVVTPGSIRIRKTNEPGSD